MMQMCVISLMMKRACVYRDGDGTGTLRQKYEHCWTHVSMDRKTVTRVFWNKRWRRRRESNGTMENN